MSRETLVLWESHDLHKTIRDIGLQCNDDGALMMIRYRMNEWGRKTCH